MGASPVIVAEAIQRHGGGIAPMLRRPARDGVAAGASGRRGRIIGRPRFPKERLAVKVPFARCLLALSMFVAAASAAATETPGAMARFYAESWLEGYKLGVEANRGVSEAFRQCVRGLSADPLALAYQRFLVRDYSPDEVAGFDAFIASPLGVRMLAYSRYRTLKARAVEGLEEVVLSDEDRRALDAYAETAVGRKFVELYTSERDTPDAPHMIATEALLQSCRTRR